MIALGKEAELDQAWNHAKIPLD